MQHTEGICEVDVRKFFPIMPDEVHELCLAPLVNIYGWPFSSLDDSTSGTRWERFFGRNSLRFWSSLKWERQCVPYTASILDQESLQRAQWISDHCGLGVLTPTAIIERTKERFWQCVPFVLLQQGFPKPLVTIKTDSGLHVVDGYHRLAAVLYVGSPPSFSFDAWVGVPSC